MLLRGAIMAALALMAWPGVAQARCRSVARCVVSAPSNASFVSTRAGGPIDATLQFGARGSVGLVTLHGHVRWRASTTAGWPLKLSAAGDLNRDGTNDFVFWVLNPLSPRQLCGTAPMRVSSLLLVDGRTGRTSSPFPPLRDICWDTATFNYPTEQYDFGSVYIGNFSPALPGRELVLTPFYATVGTVWHRSSAGDWTSESFPFPSTPAYDQTYDAANATPCSHPSPTGPCFVKNSHVANGVFLHRGFFVLTSARAVIYRPDLTPTADTTWFPGSRYETGGRNYGLVEGYRKAGRTYVDLIGGCSVIWTWRAMLPGASSTGGNPNCAIAHHFERFDVTGDVRRVGRYYGYIGTDGVFGGRVEYPAHPRAPLGGRHTSWTAFNVFRARWTTQVFRGPMRTRPLSLPGWFVWATIRTGKRAVLLATRVRRGRMVTRATFDVLRWNGSRFRSVQHVAGAVPAFVYYAVTERRHTHEDALFGTYARDVRGDARRELLVASPSGGRRFVTLR